MDTALGRTETFGYDPELDQLTSASYGDGLPNATPTWGYDAAGNRADAACDALNRATSLGGVACQNDVLGNRTVNGMRKSGLLYAWDPLSRLASFTDNGAPGSRSEYAYRADGMRVAKARGPAPAKEAPFAPTASTRYRHDGQMGIEDAETSASGTSVTRYGLGARGVDLIERTSASGTVTAFPLYDAHGNNVASLTRSGAGYGVNDRRSYDAWGQVRAQQSAGDPKLRYCGSLGHKADDESGLIYMRARYYEPTSGRFISEDPGMDGSNWFVYCGNDPVNFVDQSGKNAAAVLMVLANAAATIIMTSVSYGLITAYFEHMYPGYKGGSLLGGAMIAAGTGFLGAAGGLGSPGSAGEPIAAENLGKFIQAALRSIRQPGVLGNIAKSAGIGASIGVIAGVATAVYEFLASDYYQES